MDYMLKYKRARANMRRIIKTPKREGLRKFCSSIGKDTTIDQVWKMLQNMSGRGKKRKQTPVLIEKVIIAIPDIEKANMLGNVLEGLHSLELGEEFKERTFGNQSKYYAREKKQKQ